MDVDQKLLRQTKFPPEFNQKVDMKKVNIEVMKKWIAGKILEILGSEDDVVTELCFNLLERERFPNIKHVQIQLNAFLDKDTAAFCKELWMLCLSAQSNAQGVPKELLEAKKLELIQEKQKKPPDAASKKRRVSEILIKFVKKSVEKGKAHVHDGVEVAETTTGFLAETPDRLHDAVEIPMSSAECLPDARETHTYPPDLVEETSGVAGHAHRRNGINLLRVRARVQSLLHPDNIGAALHQLLALRTQSAITTSLLAYQMGMGAEDEREDPQTVVVEIAPFPQLRDLAHVRPDLALENDRHHPRAARVHHLINMTVDDESVTPDQRPGRVL
ncbi:MAG: hypothetical protein M1822_004951 [Bathelium mastoideum]|nr:MAG: hypothetical protein M1822_004951 [Bathelium mastoideum]